MTQKTAKKILLVLTLIWTGIGLVLAVLAVSGILTKSMFQWAFAGGFSVYALLALGLGRILLEPGDQ